MYSHTINILVIKHGALGDMVLATGAFRAIRNHHPDLRLILLTTKPFDDLIRPMDVFDKILLDRRPKGIAGVKQRILTGLQLRSLNIHRVYDLQHSSRTATYHQIMRFGRALEWSGIAKGCSHPHGNPDRDKMHTVERTAEQLRDAGLPDYSPYDLNWLGGDISDLHLPDRYALLVPNASPKRPEKVWPLDRFTALAKWLHGKNIIPVVIGAGDDTDAGRAITEAVPDTIDLTGRTDFNQLASVGRAASLAVGNDTGPMHLFAPLGTPSIVLFSHASEPIQTAPRGPNLTVLRRPTLDQLSVNAVVKVIE